MAGGGEALGAGAGREKRGDLSKRKKKKRIGFRLDMTPLVDITFLLLTFFMFTTTMATPQIMEMRLPPEIYVPIEVKESELLTILVSPQNNIYWHIGTEEPKQVELNKITAIAERENLRYEVRNKLITALKIHEEANYGLVVAILDQLNLAEMAITQEIAKQPDEEGNPTKRERRFTIAPMMEDELEKVILIEGLPPTNGG